MGPKTSSYQTSGKPTASVQTTVEGARGQTNPTLKRNTTNPSTAKQVNERKKDTAAKPKESPTAARVSKCQVGRKGQRGGVALPTAMLNVHGPSYNGTR